MYTRDVVSRSRVISFSKAIMRTIYKKFAITVVVVYVLGFWHAYAMLTGRRMKGPIVSGDIFDVATPGCKLSRLNPYDPTITKYLKWFPRITCKSKPLLIYLDGDWLSINRSVLERHYHSVDSMMSYNKRKITRH